MLQSSIPRTLIRVAFQLRQVPTAPANAARAFSSFPSLRPTVLPRTTAISRPDFLAESATSSSPLAAGAEGLQLTPKSAVTTHPALAGTQVRFAPRNTMQRHTRLVQKRRHGFLSRIRTASGRKTLARRRAKGRKKLAW